MRITNNMMIMNMMNNMHSNLGRLDKVQQQMSSQKKFRLPSDDPIGVSKSLKYNTDLSKIEQYKRNVNDAVSWLEITESSVAELVDIFQRVREITVEGATDSYGPEDLEKISAEVKQIREQIIKVANTKYANRSIFSGYKTDKDVLDEDGNYNVNLSITEKSAYNVGPADSILINTVGNELFGRVADSGYTDNDAVAGEKCQMLEVIDNLIQGLDNDDNALIDNSIAAIDDTMKNLLSIGAGIGAKTNRLDLNMNRLEEQKLSVTKLLSNNEDVDMSEVIMNLKMMENVYNASLSAGARVIQPSLIDFLG
ncbi:flagellar hook-associated protein FlgL [Clostridium sp. D2Q-14]|uniref:flagellar hook-associated protein FlgL n=1 Tax=Anaeromonas gelatinilytica TaxID=2683194 RepID=UPI00193C4929|nr:flagellar hook-associated protein FlgL [Anaeromonas gelatinilytica]MBS4535785.1 flagellar hook-associated protein FlgL [Anaeromonas gelatinilytica]